MNSIHSIFTKTIQKLPKKKKPNKKTIYILGCILLVCVSIFLVFLAKNISAQAADSILRPLLGEKDTLALEAVYFNTQDKVTAGEYSLLGSKLIPIVKESSLKLNNVDQMDLATLIPNPQLSPLPGEGQWVSVTQNLFPNQTVMAKTFIRPDITHPYALVYLVKIDMQKLGISAEAGTYYPGNEHKAYGPGIVPKSIQNAQTLLAAFNGGFQEKDGQYGMVVGTKTYVPLKMNLPTLVMYKDGSVAFTTYTGQTFSPDVAALRQNGPYLVENGSIPPYVEQGNDTWGRTITNSIYTWRSGLGITSKGNLVYAAGNALLPQALAKALQEAGAVNAIQLDINPPWVRFIVYEAIGNGRYTFTPLIPSMQGGKEYLKGYNKDFFYIYKK